MFASVFRPSNQAYCTGFILLIYWNWSNAIFLLNSQRLVMSGTKIWLTSDKNVTRQQCDTRSLLQFSVKTFARLSQAAQILFFQNASEICLHVIFWWFLISILLKLNSRLPDTCLWCRLPTQNAQHTCRVTMFPTRWPNCTQLDNFKGNLALIKGTFEYPQAAAKFKCFWTAWAFPLGLSAVVFLCPN